MTGDRKQIAVIGQACRLPGGADSPDAFWRLLMAGTDAVTSVPAERFDQARYYHPDPGQPGRSYSFAAGTIGDVAGFDAAFFGISAREAEQMDPQQRLLLELTYEAFESAGQVPARLAGSDCSVYVGISASDYAERRMGDLETTDSCFMLGATLSIAANRISYVFDLRGPSIAVDTACSSSLVALHEAVQALQAGRSQMAVVGGVNMLLSPAPFVGFAKAMMLAKDGRCRAFGKGGLGYVRSEGAGVLILKPLAEAKLDGDPILAVIRGVGVNTDGRTHGIAMPSSASQEALLRKLYREVRVPARAVSYVEAHGTGTAAGDPAEAGAIGRALGRRRSRTNPLLIGSAKTNIGHLESAAGMAGVLKAIGILRHGTVPRSLHAEELNPDIPFEALNLKVARETTPLRHVESRSVVGINSFGFGGTNAHAILEAYTPSPLPPDTAPVPDMLPFTLSARSPEALREVVRRSAARLEELSPQDWSDVCYTATCRRSHHDHRLLLWAKNLPELKAKLAGYAEGGEAFAPPVLSRQAKLALVFVGNGAQWRGMGRRLLEEDPLFREALVRVDQVARWRLGWSVLDMLASDEAAMDDTRIAQPLLFALQVALVDCLTARGLRFDGTIGHSVGEVAAAHVAGALSLEQAVRVIRERSEAQAGTKGHGRMLVVALDEAAARALIAPLGGAVEIAAINSPRSITLSGDAEAILSLADSLRQRGIAGRLLDLDYAFHSHLQDGTRETLLDALAGLEPKAGPHDFYSTVRGARTDGTALNADYWWHNMRDVVHFRDAVGAMEADGYRIFLEIGPDTLLLGNLRHNLKGAKALGTLSQEQQGFSAVTRALDGVYLLGAEVNFAPFFPGGGRPVDLPSYPWQRQTHWAEPTVEAGINFTTRHDAPLLGLRVAPHVNIWEELVDTGRLSWLADHKVEASAIFPAAAFVEMALEAGGLVFGIQTPLEIEGLEIARPLVLDAPRMVRFTLGEAGFFRIESREHMRKGGWTSHVTGRLATLSNVPARTAPATLKDDAVLLSGAEHYAFAAARGFAYGPHFQVLDGVRTDGVTAQAQLTRREGAWRLHPALLDGLLQSVVPLLRQRASGSGGDTFLPHKIARLVFNPAAAMPAQAEIALTGQTARAIIACGVLRDADGHVAATVQNLRLTRLALKGAIAPAAGIFNSSMQPLPSLIPQAVPENALAAARTVLARPAPGSDTALLDRLASNFAADALLTLGEAEIPATSQPLLAQLIAMVEGDADACGDAGDSWRTTLASRPDLVAELAVLGRAGLALPQRLRDGAAAPAGGIMREQLFDGARVLGAGIAQLCDAVRAFSDSWPTGRRLRVLVAGAAESMRQLASVLPPDLCDVTVGAETDEMATLLQARLSGLSHVTVTGLRELPRGAADLVVAAHVPYFVLGQLGLAAAPGALLFLAEVAPSPWTLFALTDSAPAGLAGWQDAQTVTRGSTVLTTARALAMSALEPQSAQQDWLLLTTGAEAILAQQLAEALMARGHHAQVQDLTAPLPVGMPLHVVHLGGMEEEGLEAQARRFDRLGALVRDAALASLTVLTRTSAGRKPEQALILGLVRVLQNESVELHARALDLDGAVAPEVVAAEIAMGTESEVLLSTTGRYAPCISEVRDPDVAMTGSDRAVLRSPGGSLDNLRWVPQSPEPLADDAVEIAVEAAGLNFRDVMFAMGVLPDEILEGGFAGATLGMEAAGRITRLGPAVQNLAVGDAVVCFAPASFGSHVMTRRFAVGRLPQGLSMREGATLIVAFFTVTYALAHLARLQRGEKILIHGAAGGVGIAAVQYARAIGAEIFATAGSDEKRDFVRLLGVADDHVLDSRSTDFADRIRSLTGGQGLDVVLNSLAGEAVHRGLSLLRPFGRFLELGKVDFVANSQIGLRAFRNNIAYHGVDADQLMAARPDLAGTVFRETMDLFASGVYAPLPYRAFARDEVVEAFRHMQRARHIGKIVLDTQAPATPAASSPASPVTIWPGATYLVTGGTAGLGLATAQWLADRGARHLVLASRNGAAHQETETIASLRAGGVRVDLRILDVADEAAVTALIGDYAATLRGVVHAAAVYDDCRLADLTPERLRAVLNPKARGALALDAATRGLPLDLFLMFSSISALIGNPGQANYVAANLVLESLAARRHGEGLAAQVVALGPVADAGHLTGRDGLADAFAKMGMRPLASAEVFAALDRLVLGGEPGLLVADVKWGKLRRALPAVKAGRFRRLDHGTGERDDVAMDMDFASLAASVSREALMDIMLVQVSQAIGQILHVPPEKLDRECSVFDLGMDSLMGLELRMSIEERFGVEISSMALAQDINVRRIAEMVCDRLTGAASPSDAAEEGAVEAADEAQARILSHHAAHIDSGVIAEALESMDKNERPRLIP